MSIAIPQGATSTFLVILSLTLLINFLINNVILFEMSDCARDVWLTFLQCPLATDVMNCIFLRAMFVLPRAVANMGTLSMSELHVSKFYSDDC